MTDTEQAKPQAKSGSRSGVGQGLTGVVRSISGEKTASVMLSTLVKHPRYGKYVRRRSKITVHCPAGGVQPGDKVEIVPCRRLSKTKSWRLVKVIRRSQAS